MSATPPLPSLEVASASFFHLECSHEQLFHTEYKRSNRTKGLKILRCFPHCCPEHIDRSYCGTSLSVRVELESGPPYTPTPRTPPPSEIMAVFARFEAVSDVSLRPGECVEAIRIAAGTQSERNLEGQWVAGTLDRPSRLVTTIRTPGTASDDQKPLVFHLNGKPFSRWYYDWESGANKAQRLMKHVLKAYIVECCSIDRDGNFTALTGHHAHTQLYRVLHVVTSPEFTVISYRRAPSEQYQAALMSVRPMVAQTLANGTYSQNSYMSDSKTDHFQPPVTVKTESSYNETHKVKRQRTTEMFVPHYSSTGFSTVLDEKLRWEYTNSTAVSVSRDIAVLYSFLRWTPLSAYATFVDDIAHLVRQNLKESSTEESSEVNKVNCFSRFLFDQADANSGISGVSMFFVGESTTTGASGDLPKDLEHLLRALAQASQWFYSANTRQWMKTFFLQYAGSVLDKHAMRACFVLFVQELQNRLDTQVFARTELRTLANTAEEVIAAVYSYPYFHSRRSQVRQILSGQNFAGWNGFVAQMRETYIGLSTRPGVPRSLANNHRSLTFDRANPPRNYVESCWNAEWNLETDESAWKFSDQSMKTGEGDASSSQSGDAQCVVSLLNVFELISQMVRIQVAIDLQECTLHLRSTQGVADELGGMRVVLDGKERIFSQFPNGVASATDPAAHGNYIGEMRVEQPKRLVAYLQIFNWSVSGNEPSYNVRMRIECWRNCRLCISGDVLITTASDSFTTKQTSMFGEMSLRDKREAVVNAHASQCIEGNSTRVDPIAATAWKQLGTFRLNYMNL